MKYPEHKIAIFIENSGVFKSGETFALREIQSSIAQRGEVPSTSRIRQVMNQLCDSGKAEPVQTDTGVHYRKRSNSRALLSRLWARPVGDHSPRWC